MNHSTELFTLDVNSGAMKQLTHVNDSIYNSIGMCKTERKWVTTTDGKKMLVWVIYPPGFDPSQKYPALLYCQGGPQVEFSTDGFPGIYRGGTLSTWYAGIWNQMERAG